MNITDIKEKCFGCGVCAVVCPVSAIAMKQDPEGFLVPAADAEKCIGCGKCRAKCPAALKPRKRDYQTYAVRCRDEKLLNKSTSGGAFSLIADTIIAMGGDVCGAVFDSRFDVHHCISKDISLMRKSKYVQSDIQAVLPEIRSRLETGKKVLFSGTPCQCAAVQSYTGDSENLYTAAVVCMGVFSPGLWKAYRKQLAKGGKLTEICFRSKEKPDDAHTFSYTADGKKVSVPFSLDPLMQLYCSGTVLRESCYSCPYTRPDVPFDFSLGDFHGIGKVLPEFDDGSGTSLVLSRGDKANGIMQKIGDRSITERVFISDCFQPALVHPMAVPPSRERYRELCENALSGKSLTDELVGFANSCGTGTVPLELRKEIYRVEFRRRIMRKKGEKLKNRSFSLISDSPLGADVLEELNIECRSPFSGVEIEPEAYLRLLKDLRKYMSRELLMITGGNDRFPVGMLGDIRIVFRRCHTEKDALREWKNGIGLFDPDNVFVLFAGAGKDTDLRERFERLPFERKKVLVTERKDLSAFKDDVSFGKVYDDFDFPGWFDSL